MIRLLSRVVPVALALLVLLPSSSAAIVSRTIDVTYTLKPNSRCVKEITVNPDELKFNYFAHRARLGSTEVIWKLDHDGKQPDPDAEWWISKTSSDHSVCEDRIDFVGDEALCPASNKFLAASYWSYTVVTKNPHCQDALVDPEIIFHKGKTSPRGIILFFLLAAAVIGTSYFWFRRKPA